MNTYHIVRIGDPPGNQGAENRGGTCAAWSDSEDKANTEVIEVGFATGEVLHRFTSAEAEKIAYEFRHPRIR
ncbi:MAG: hypothetical protein DMG97_37480 [Acidobacteria bacterium]|nr:MAG: hypothetical protein DMG97_37480 [Acidobacteriota bacterium]